MLNCRPVLGSREPTNFWGSPLSPSIILVRGIQIGKTKLSVRKAEERHRKEGQKGRKEASQA
jgi:hypothetical protein